MRRLALALSLSFLGDYPMVQTSMFFILSSLVILYIIDVKPYKENYKNKIDLINEFCLLGMAYNLWAFTDF